MSRNLVVNTTPSDRAANSKKWTPSPEMAIREEDGEPARKRKLSQSTAAALIEEEDEEEEEEEEAEASEEDEDEEEEEEADNDSDYTSSPSIPDENINFDLVYTLHTFEATVDGQASVKKGDALTLLDDSNSYWWLIRDLKTSEVGYIPAENIETPFERLARLNKHRNVELTSIEQAAHYIKDPPVQTKNTKKVVLSTSVNVQLHVILVGEDGEDEDEQEEAYEEWDEEMLDDDEEDEGGQQTNTIRDISVDTDSKNNNECEVQQPTTANNTATTATIAATATAAFNNHATEKPTTRTTTKPVSRVVEEDEITTIPTKVLRVFAGNVDVGASYHSVRVTESTTVDELLLNAMEKFHISQIETKHGQVHKNSCVEYYLTVKTRDNEEITLDPKDKPFTIHESLTAHLTTPMPSLTQFRQLNADYGISKTVKKKKRSSSFVGDTSIQFLMHKRIKRVNAQSGKVHIKVSLMTVAAPKETEKLNAIKKITTLGRFGRKKKEQGVTTKERIDKMIAIPANISISDLTSTALVKFHIISDENQPHQYRLVLNANGKDTLLNSNQILSDVLRDLGENEEKYFVLHIFNHHLDDQQQAAQKSLSLSSSTSSSSNSNNSTNNRSTTTSKVFPAEISRNSNSSAYSHHHPVMTRLDSTTEAILRRIDAALEAYEKGNNRVTKKNFVSSPMSVSRNESGVDIHLPHGLLRSTALDEKKTQYSLMTAPNTLVVQKVLPGDNCKVATKGGAGGAANVGVSGEEMATLIKYGSQYLDTYDTANKPSLLSASNRLFMDKDIEKSLSSLDDLEKELQRIIKSHSS